MSTKEIEAKAKMLKILKNKQETLQQEIDQLEADLKGQLEAWGKEEVQAGPFRIVWKMVNSSRFDSKRFKEENGNLYSIQLQKLLHGVGILVVDHIIVANDNTYSMIMHGDIDYRVRGR